MDIRSLVTRLGYKVDTKGLKKGEKAITRYARNVKRIAVASIAAVGVAVLGIGVASVKTAAEMESINAAFEVMTGSASVAKKMMEDITKMSLKTPFDFMDLAKTAEQMLNANIAVEDIMGNLQMLGDVAGKDKERLKSLTRAFGQISQATRLNGEDLNQLIDAGFNPLLVIGEKTGKTYTQLRKEMSKGLISAAQVKDAFRTVTSEGGRFYKNMEAQNKTMGGQWGMFLGLIKQVRAEIGKKLSPVIIKALRWANRIILTKLIPTTKKWLDSMRPMLDYVDYIAATLRALPGILKAIKVAFGPEISGLKKMLKLVASITLEYHKLLLNILKSEAFLKTVGWLFQRIYNILSVTIKGWLRLFQLLDHVLKQLNRSAAEKHEARQRNVSKIMSDLFTRKEGFSTDKEGVSSRRGKTLDLAGLQKFFADRRNFVARHLKKQGLDKDFKKEKGLLDSDTKTGKKPETFTERMVAAMKAMKKEAAAIGEIAKARRETRINNLNLNVEQNVQIDAPAAKTGETGLSGQGLDAAMRKAQTALWTAQLNKLTTASIGS